MKPHVLTLNAGSSSIKFSLVELGETLVTRAVGEVEGLGGRPRLRARGDETGTAERDLDPEEARDPDGALAAILGYLRATCANASVAAIGHRVVHGGSDFDQPILIDDQVLAALAKLEPWAPLHQPHNVAGIRAARAAFPEAPQIACFDTAFHRGHKFVDDAFALPRHFFAEGIRRYGFHGISYDFVSRRLFEIAPEVAFGRVVIAHLGNGASMCALRGGKSVASTMGFSTLDGLAMGTRPGQIDPGVLLYLMQARGMDAPALSDLLYNQSGLKGLSGLSNDMRELEASDDSRAHEAIAYFVHRIRRELGSLAAALGGLDALVFCGGIGENSARVRAGVMREMDWLGIEADAARNAAHAGCISSDASRVRAYVIATNEELRIAEMTAAAGLGRGPR